MKGVVEVTTKMYNKYPEEKVVGYFRGPTPELIIRDPDVVRDILSVDFAYFYPRGLGRNTEIEPLHQNIFHLDGDLWKLLRQRLTPAFTTSKLKNMFPLIVMCTEKLETTGNEIVAAGGECDVYELMARFSTDFIGSCGFGLEMDAINNENSVFRKIGKKIFDPSLTNDILIMLWEIFPGIRKFIRMTDNNLERSFTSIIMKIFEQRNFKPSGRNDFVDFVLDLAGKGKIIGDSIEHRHSDGSPKKIELEMNSSCLIAQIYLFFAAGFETSSSSTSYTLHELAFNLDIQEKIQDEIDRVLLKHDNRLCYEAVAEMTLLDMAFKEAMRIVPPGGRLHRVCASKYTISQLGISIDPGVKILIPSQALHNDKLYFKNPEVFNPERFGKNEINEINKYVYMPFGEGPRACIGARLGQMQSLAGLAAVLRNFTVVPSEKSKRKLTMNPRLRIIQGVLNGIPLKLKLREK
ncbi:cytochrome P450 6a2-like [Nymphalis io]|uniref:cytochrome P450 6a2-like n=1 Tax=Inachis io TaxID=171585 RepID=UPI00216A5571|nr:cytochrome P450 6a2-like [Nymphalis io]